VSAAARGAAGYLYASGRYNARRKDRREELKRDATRIEVEQPRAIAVAREVVVIYKRKRI
jgi:hypothetical protein